MTFALPVGDRQDPPARVEDSVRSLRRLQIQSPLLARDRAELERVAGEHSRLGQRARVVLLGADGASAHDIARSLRIGRLTVYKWLRRYEQGGIAALEDRARSGQPRKLSEVREQMFLYRTLHALPHDGTTWSIRRLAAHAAVTEHQVRSVWHRAGIDDSRLARARDAVELWLADGWHEPVGLCIAPPHTALVLGNHGGTWEPDAQSRHWPSRSQHDRTRAGSLYTAYDRAALDTVTPAARAKRLADVLRECVALASNPSELRIVFSTDWSTSSPPVATVLAEFPTLRSTVLPTMDAWAIAVEALLAALADAPSGSRTALRVGELRHAIERFSSSGAASHPSAFTSECHDFVWIAKSTQPVRNSATDTDSNL